MGNRIRFRLKQDGIPVAWAEGQNAMAEIGRYAFVYSQNAPVTVEMYSNGKWRKFPSTPRASGVRS